MLSMVLSNMSSNGLVLHVVDGLVLHVVKSRGRHIAPLATPSQLAVGMALILLVVAEFRAYLGVCASHQPLRPAALLES